MLFTTKNKSKTIDLELFSQQCEAFARVIVDKKPEIIKLLSTYETVATVEHEIKSSLDTLLGIREEFKAIVNPRYELTISAFFPLNLPLYSLILYGIVPSIFCKKIYIRPPQVMHDLLNDLVGILGIGQRSFSAISIKQLPRNIFVNLYAKDSDVILFTGKYENVLSVHELCPQALIIYEGTGVCPFIVCPDADVDLAVTKAVEMRCFNSGQDCVAPDAFFVHEKIAEQFISKLEREVKKLKVGVSDNPEVRVSHIVKTTHVIELKSWLEKEYSHIKLKGKIDLEKNYVYPTIVVKKIQMHTGEFYEFFSPVFYILTYKDDNELVPIFRSAEFIDHSMYVSQFGSTIHLNKYLSLATVLKNKIVNDVEQGNHPYGGYGHKANFLLYGNNKLVKPILISSDINHIPF